MATKVKGITIELKADSSGLEKALKDINKSLSTTQKDLKEVNKALKLDPKNTELLEQKQRLLADAISKTEKKLKDLKAAQDKLADRNTENGQRQYDALTREISKTTNELKSLNAEQNQNNVSMQQAKTSSSGFVTGLDKISVGADRVARATAAMSAASLGALTGMVGLVVNASKFADEMLTVSQQTGFSTDTLQKMAYAAEMVDVPMETIVGSLRKMKSNLDDQSGVWDQLGVSVRDQKGEYRDIEDIFFDTVTALGNIENETERDTMAMELFGRSADELAGILDDGGQALRDIGDEAEDLGVIVSADDLQSLAEFNNALETMKSQLKGAAAQAAVPILEAMAPVVSAVASGFRTFASVLSDLNPRLIQIGMVFLAVIASISPVAKIISSVSTGFSAFLRLLPAIISGIEMLNAAFMSFASNPYVLIIAGIVAALALLAAGIYYVASNWDTIGPAAQDALTSMKTGISDAIATVKSFGQSIVSDIGSKINEAAETFGDIKNAAESSFGQIPSLISRVSEAFGDLANSAKEVISDISSVFNNLASKAGQAGSEIMNAFLGGLRSVISNILQSIKALVDQITGLLKSGVNSARSAGAQTAKAYMQGLNSAQPSSGGGGGLFSMPFGNPFGGGGGGGNGGGGNGYAGAGNGALLGAINELNRNIERYGSGTQNVNVELVGSAKNIFDTVRVQNNRLQTATGYHALA